MQYTVLLQEPEHGHFSSSKHVAPSIMAKYGLVNAALIPSSAWECRNTKRLPAGGPASKC
jgi:hypothetical protein